MIAGASMGAIVGGGLGKETSPNKESDPVNMVLGAIAGGISGALFGSYLWDDSDPIKDMPSIENKSESVPGVKKYIDNDLAVLPNGIQGILKNKISNPSADDYAKRSLSPLNPYIKIYAVPEKIFYDEHGNKVTVKEQQIIEQGAE